MTEIGTLHGTQDYYGDDLLCRNSIMSRARAIFLRCGFSEVSTPIIEKAEVFDRNLGKSSDIVEKEMYAFKDNGGRYVALRPEGTSGVARAILDRGTGVDGVRVFYMGEMFRGECSTWAKCSVASVQQKVVRVNSPKSGWSLLAMRIRGLMPKLFRWRLTS